MSQLSISGLSVEYPGKRGPVQALRDFTLDVADGEFGVLLGPSGCGKSTALNAVAGLVNPTTGSITIGDEVVFDARRGKRGRIPPNRRPIGMVFQSYALWPHLSVADNVAYPLKRKGMSKQEQTERLERMLELVRCVGLGDRYPGQLSGGQQQRVALARAISTYPPVLLFDEPLSNLDAGLRAQLRDELKQLHHELGFTALYVTHDQSEALALGTKIAVMRQGEVVQVGKPREIYERPNGEYVARFFGYNILPGRAESSRDDGGGRVSTPLGAFDVADLRGREGDVTVAIHPNRLSVESSSRQDGPRVKLVTYVGTHTEVIVESGGHTAICVEGPSEEFTEGSAVQLSCSPAYVNVLVDGEVSYGLDATTDESEEDPAVTPSSA